MNRTTNNEASGSWSSSMNVNSTGSASSCGSTNSSAVNKVDMDTGCFDYEILWEDLTIGEQIGQGSEYDFLNSSSGYITLPNIIYIHIYILADRGVFTRNIRE